jgi:WD40 repeat protein
VPPRAEVILAPSLIPSRHLVDNGARIVTASEDNTARIWDAHFARSTKDLVIEMCTRRLRGLATLSRGEMRLVGYPDNVYEIDVCKGIE